MNKVWSAYAFELSNQFVALRLVIPEKELPLCLFLAVSAGGIDRFHGIWIYSCIEYLSAQCHGSGCKILYLFKLEVELFGYYGKFSHILLSTTRVAAYKVWYYLLLEPAFTVDTVKCFLEILKLAERRFAHQCEHAR